MSLVLDALPSAAAAGSPSGRARPAARTLRVADLALLAAVAGLTGLLPLGGPVKAALVGAFALLGPGAAVLTCVPIPKYARLAAVPTLSAALITLTTITAMWSYRWHPTGILVLGCLAVAASSLYRYARTGAWPVPRTWIAAARHRAATVPAARLVSPPVVLTVVALIVWAAAMPSLPGTDASFYGLVVSGSGWLLIPATALTTIAFGWAMVTGRFGAGVFAVAAMIVVLRVTTWAGTEVPLYDWTYKHIGVVRYVQEHGLITPNGTDIYTQWPAFFVASAWFCDVTTLDPMTLAHLFAPLMHVLIAVIVYSAARQLRQPPRTALMAVFLAEIANWVGQDYFSPQAWAIVLAYGMLVLLLSSRGAPRAGVLAIIPFAAMVPSHQLTPFWVVGAAAALVLFRCARPRWAVVAMMLIVGVYLVLNLDAVAPYGIFTGGNPVANATSNITMAGVPAKEYTSLVCRGLSAAVFAAAAASAVWGWRTRRPGTLGCAVIAFCALGLLLAQGYGGEAVFRVYLYSLLGCALLIAPAVTALLDRWHDGPRGALAAGSAATALLVASLAGLYSFFALWPIVVETRSQVGMMAELIDSSEPGSRFMMMAASGIPFRSTAHYAELTLADPYFDNPIHVEYGARWDLFPTPKDLGYLEWKISQTRHRSYIVFSPQSENRMDYYGMFRPDSDDRLKQALEHADGWTKVYDDSAGTVVYRHEAAVR